MGGDLKDVKRLLREVVGANPNLPITATIKSVEGDHCAVELKSGLVLSDVKLKATITEGEDFVRMIPKAGSTVLLLSLSGNLDNLTVIKMDEMEKLEYSQNGLKVIVDCNDGKVAIQNESVSLKEILTLLATLLKGLKVFTPVGPSGVPLPDTITKINEFETKFNQLLKDV